MLQVLEYPNPIIDVKTLSFDEMENVEEFIRHPMCNDSRLSGLFGMHLKDLISRDKLQPLIDLVQLSKPGTVRIATHRYVPKNILELFQDWLCDRFVNDTLIALVEDGPLFDGDVPSKSHRDELLRYELATKIIHKGEEGFQAASYLAGDLYRHHFKVRSIRSGKVKRTLLRHPQIWYLRDNHTTCKLPLDVEKAIKMLRTEWDSGERYGLLTTTHDFLKSVKPISANDDLEDFEKRVRDWYIQVNRLVDKM